MENHKASLEGGRVLAVDDEPVARQQLVFQIAALGHGVTVAASAEQAQEILFRVGSSAFDCLITDCWMPGLSGLDLLLWLKNHDHTLASIVISKAADEHVITQTLRGGGSDFLKKPVFSAELAPALQKTIESTRRRRHEVAASSALREVGIVQRRMNNLGMAGQLTTPLTVCYHPRHEAGGDSVAFFPLDRSRALLVVADVSGHDLKSAFVSAYFQGTLRALVEEGLPAGAILSRFNRFLIDEWNGFSKVDGNLLPEITSLAVCAASIDLEAGSLRLLHGGFPLASWIDMDGLPRSCGETGGFPLGWIEPNPIAEWSGEVKSSDRLVVWTDGLEDFARQLQISAWSLAFRILLANEAGQSPAWLDGAPDDILLVVAGFAERDWGTFRFPIFTESYPQSQIDEVDELQALWQRSLAFAFPELAPQRFSEILLCTREAVLNGLRHGCSKPSDGCRLTMVFDNCKQQLRVDVTDPGPGYDFDLQASAQLREGHSGLTLIESFPKRVERNLTGSAIRMFFELEHETKGY